MDTIYLILMFVLVLVPFPLLIALLAKQLGKQPPQLPNTQAGDLG
jgi:hypothetical protein